MANKLLSIVVPTKDRYKYLKYLISLIASFNSDEIELVIQDNSENNTEFLAYLNSLEYDFIRYDYNKGQIPMSINADKAILNSTGEFVCFLGDDDGLTKYVINCARWMKETGVDAVKSSTISYYWPDISQGTQNKPVSVLRYNSFSGKIVYLSAYKELIKVLKGGILDRGRMPLVYHSIVRRDVLDKVYDKVGSYFPGNSPDISNAVALSLVVGQYAFIDFPLAFSGWSVYHGGGVHATGKKGQPEINEIPWFRPNPESNWDEKVPRIAAGALIWADSAISALKNMKEGELYKVINFSKMYASFVLHYPEYRDRVESVCTDIISFKIALMSAVINKYAKALFRRIGWYTGLSKKAILVNNMDDVIKASRKLEQIGSTVPSLFKAY